MKNIILRIVIVICIIFLCMSLCNVVKAISSEDNQGILYSQRNSKKMIKTTDGLEISSEKYLISELYSYIGRILPRTTVKQFKMIFNVSEEKIHIYKDESLKEEINSGYIASNMIIRFDGVNKSYIANVVGDFNGDGIANQIEVKELIKHIVKLKGYKLTEMQLLSADMNKDGEVNQIDLTILINYIVFGRLNVGEIERPESPEIQVLDGELSSTGWYIQYPNIKIIERENTSKEKTTYKIDGAVKVEETTIPEDGIIPIEKDGIYNITSYTYSKDGVRSIGAKVTIRCCLKAIEEADIDLEMKINDKDGETYTSGTWTNQNVYIRPIQIIKDIDEQTQVELHMSYIVVGSTTVATKTNEEMIIENEGESTIIVTVTDEIGRTKTKEFKVNIDKTLPEKPSMEIEGTKLDSEYYNTDIGIVVNDNGDNLSGISRITYELQGAINQEEVQIGSGEKILIIEDGETKVIVKTYDNAGNVNYIEQNFKRDTQAPSNITITASEKTGTGYKLTATAEDTMSGILKYDFYIDGNRYKTIETDKNEVSILVTNQHSGVHAVHVIVTDNAENIDLSPRINVETEKLIINEIDHIEFEITSFNLQNAENELDREAVQGIISDTSLTTESKYIQITVNQNGTMATMEGKMKIIRKDGVVLENITYFPEDLILEVSHLADGSGSTFRHYTMSEILENKIFEGEKAESLPARSMSILARNAVGNRNIFKVTEKKISGVSAYTRFTIENVTIGGKKVDFKITQNL